MKTLNQNYHLFKMYKNLTSSPTPPAKTMESYGMESKPTLQGTYGISIMVSDKWLSRYGLLENFDTEISHFEQVLDFDV